MEVDMALISYICWIIFEDDDKDVDSMSIVLCDAIGMEEALSFVFTEDQHHWPKINMQ